MPELTTKSQLESRLKAFAARLVARQIVRGAFSGVAGAAIGLALGLIFLELLPRLLLGSSSGVWPLVLSASAGFVLAVARELRSYRMPSLLDAALALESRLERDSGALAAALRMTEQHAFFTPVMAGARQDLHDAERAKAPVLIRTRKLVLVPLIALASGVVLAAVAGAEPPGPASAGLKAPEPRLWTTVDVGGGRSEADRQAYRKALGMKEAAASLNESAAVLRNAAAGTEQHAAAMKDARTALTESGSESAARTASELPAEAPADTQAREELAAMLEAAAKGLGHAAAALQKGASTGSEDSGGTGKFESAGKTAELVAMPVWDPAQPVPTRAMASQTPARRELASRAVRELEALRE